jgi:3-(3-hydroxy-phenyl)propionate hydroxylase
MILKDFDADVLVVGFGPTGATLSALLAQAGLSVVAVDQALDLHPLPRAVHFDAEIMRIFQSLGLAEALGPHIVEAPDYEFRTAKGEVLMRIASRPMTPLGWASGYMFHQPGLERTLRARAMAEPALSVRLGVRFEAFAQDADGVTVTLDGPQGRQALRCRYLVGCDGGPSLVRDCAGLALEDLKFDEPWLVVDTRPGAGHRLPDINLQICDPRRPTTCVLAGPGRHRWEFMLLPGEDPAAVLADGFAEPLIAAWAPGDGFEIERKAVYRFHGLIAQSWRNGRVLIAGDAAHQMPPMAGQGLCSGIRDAFNLAWKLAAVAGGADDALLDTYEAERSPHARQVIDLAIGLGRVVCAQDPAVAAVRDEQMLAARAAGAAPPPMAFSAFATGLLMSGAPGAGTLFPQPVIGEGEAAIRLDEVLGAGAWLITRSAPGAERDSTPGPRLWGLDAPQLAGFGDPLHAWLDQHGVDAVLVRPDRVVFGAGDAAAISAAYRAAQVRPAMAAA